MTDCQSSYHIRSAGRGGGKGTSAARCRLGAIKTFYFYDSVNRRPIYFYIFFLTLYIFQGIISERLAESGFTLILELYLKVHLLFLLSPR